MRRLWGRSPCASASWLAAATAAFLTGITEIKAGESVVILETSNLATTKESLLQAWFGASRPAGLQVGACSGSGLGLIGTLVRRRTHG